jgi:RNA recognition motif-containing protein
MNIYVGNLSHETTEDDLRQAFEAFGQVESATVIKDKFSGESRGFGFVEMPSKTEAQKAIDEMNGKDLKGRALNVNEARPKAPRGGGGGGGGGHSGGGGGGRRQGGFGGRDRDRPRY